MQHYQSSIKANSLCTKKKVLEAFEEKIEGHINVQIQFNLDDMKNYCSKETNFISEQYSGKIYNFRTSDLIPLSPSDQMERKKFYSMIQKTNIKFFLESISILTYTGMALK